MRFEPGPALRALVMNPVFIILVVGIAARLALFPLTPNYDSDGWALIVRNIRIGEGLYAIDNYYYTPVWGYMLSLNSTIQGVFLNVDVLGMRIPEVFPVEASEWMLRFTATVTSLAFNAWTKVMFLISDLIVGYLIYWIVRDLTGDKKKAAFGLWLWFLCPLVIAVTSVSEMFDSFAVLFALLCVIMIRKDRPFFAGILFTFAFMTKFFPIFLLFLLVAYLLVNHQSDGKAKRSLLMAALGAAFAFIVLMLPQIMDGTFSEAFLFITSRVGADGVVSTFNSLESVAAISVYIVCLIISFILGWKLYKGGTKDLDKRFFMYSAIILTLIFLFPPTPQYLLILVAFLSIYIAASEKGLMRSWIILSVGGALFVFGSHFTLALSMGAFSDLVSLDSVMSLFDWFQASGSSFSPATILYLIGGVLEYIGILSIVLFFVRKGHSQRTRDAAAESG
ncbi:MAG: glycosyltransferase family 39 protein [Methanomassiliicoccaceae archaeon]|nr:glycosyltransferase family 39 protein [Methanomassiliicoccaceae archaeon]